MCCIYWCMFMFFYRLWRITCVQNASVTAYLALVPCVLVGVRCPPSAKWAIGSRRSSMVQRRSSQATMAVVSCPKDRRSNRPVVRIWCTRRIHRISVKPIGKPGRWVRRADSVTIRPSVWTDVNCCVVAAVLYRDRSRKRWTVNVPSGGVVRSHVVHALNVGWWIRAVNKTEERALLIVVIEMCSILQQQKKWDGHVNIIHTHVRALELHNDHQNM